MVGNHLIHQNCFNRINSGRSIPTASKAIWKAMKEKFQSYQFRQINPDVDNVDIHDDWSEEGFNRINSGRSIPTRKRLLRIMQRLLRFNRINSGRSIPTRTIMVIPKLLVIVSIVSIQADQSRPHWWCQAITLILRFQSYQFRQINPDSKEAISGTLAKLKFQSYQFRQINPDLLRMNLTSSQQMVSIVSIQADQSRRDLGFFTTKLIAKFQSYQFRQINPDKAKIDRSSSNRNVSIVSIQADQSRPYYNGDKGITTYSFNRINSGRSIPTFNFY